MGYGLNLYTVDGGKGVMVVMVTVVIGVFCVAFGFFLSASLHVTQTHEGYYVKDGVPNSQVQACLHCCSLIGTVQREVWRPRVELELSVRADAINKYKYCFLKIWEGCISRYLNRCIFFGCAGVMSLNVVCSL